MPAPTPSGVPNMIRSPFWSFIKVLRYAIKMGGTTLNDFYSPDGNQGYFKFKLNVYGRDDKKCRVCSNNIKKTIIGQRATFSCDNCQI